MGKIVLIALSLIALSIALGIYLYPLMPDRMASHWNIRGEADGYSTKDLALFLVPGISVVLLAFFVLIPYIDPLGKNIERFRRYFDGFIVLILAFLFYLHLLTLSWNLGYRFSMPQALSPAFGVLFYYTGIVLQKAKRNWFVGIRTPWTLSSDLVWERTHALGGKLFKACGVISLLGVLFPGYAIFIMLAPVIATSAYTVVYSYLQYRRTLKNRA